MKIAMLTFYVLIWPVVSFGVLALLCVSLWRDIKNARANGEDMI